MITEKRLNNKRFRRTEEAILRAFFEENSYVSVEKMARRAGVARSTIYDHHRAVREIIPDYKRYILKKYNRMVNKEMRRKQMQMAFLKMLTFIARNRKIFTLFTKVNDREVLMAMIDKIGNKIKIYAKLPKNDSKIYMVYRGEMLAVLEEWAEGGYKNEEMEQIIKDMMYLTDTAKIRLGKLQ